jgi:hypothetical protein
MLRHIFYSWQSDLPNATNRSFILKALENAAKDIAADETINVEPVIDRDTKGIAGAPDIAKTIFEKIDSADVFVADVSIIPGDRESL